MRYHIVKKEEIDLFAPAFAEEKLTIQAYEEGDIKTNTNIDLNNFISENMGLIKQISPLNPCISKQDEWRTDDYSEYDKICNYTKQRGRMHGKTNQSVGHMARRVSLRRKP